MGFLGVMKRMRPRGQRGFTLIELLVSSGLLVLIAAAIAGATDVGVRTLGSGGAGDRLAGDHDLFALEQTLGRDMARAECVYDPPSTKVSGYCQMTKTSQSTGAAYSTCGSPPSLPPGRTDSSGVAYSSSSNVVTDAQAIAADVGSVITGSNIPTNAVILTVVPGTSFTISNTPTGAGTSVTIPPATVLFCAAWSQFWETPSPSGASGSCHVASYYSYKAQVYREESAVFVNTSATTVEYTQHVTTQSVSLSAVLGASGDVRVTLKSTAAGVKSPPTATYDYRALGTLSQTGTQLC
jgi:prepilin-type N-terminal cleavage/methylation domain-containing protein